MLEALLSLPFFMVSSPEEVCPVCLLCHSDSIGNPITPVLSLAAPLMASFATNDSEIG